MSQAAEHLADQQGAARRRRGPGRPDARASEAAKENSPHADEASDGYATTLDLREHRAESREAMVDIADHAQVVRNGQRKIRAEIRKVSKRTVGENALLNLREDFNSKFNSLTDKFNGLIDKFNALNDRFVELKGEVQGLEGRLQRLEVKVDGLSSNVSFLKWFIGGAFVLLSIQMAIWGLR